MNHLFSAISLFIRKYWRKSRFLLQLVFLILCIGFLFHPHRGPHEYQYWVLVINLFLLSTALVTTYQLIKTISTDPGQKRLPRRTLYMGVLLTGILITACFNLILILYGAIFPGLSSFFPSIMRISLYGLLNLWIIVAGAMLFSDLGLGNVFHLPGLILICLSAIPDWYLGLPGEALFSFISYLLPPLGQSILIQQNSQLFSWVLPWLFLYGLFLTILGHWVWQKKSSQ